MFPKVPPKPRLAVILWLQHIQSCALAPPGRVVWALSSDLIIPGSCGKVERIVQKAICPDGL